MITKIEMQAMEAVIGIHKEMCRKNGINWEQRLYDCAKDIYPFVIRNINSSEDKRAPARVAVEFAEYLIDELVAKRRLG